MQIATLQARAVTGARLCAAALGVTIPVSVALDNILLVLILALWLAAGDYKSQIASLLRHPVALTALALFCMLAAGVVYSSAGGGAGVVMLGKYADLAFVPVFVCLFRDLATRERAWLALTAALAATLLLSCLVWLGLMAGNHMVYGTSGNPEVFKRYLTQTILLAFGAYLFANLACNAAKAWQRWIWAALAVLSAFNVLVMMQGRTGQIILLALALYYAYAHWRWKGAAGAAIVIVLALTLVVGSGGAIRLVATLGEMQEQELHGPDGGQESSTGQRMEFYRNSVEIVRVHPLLGTGTGSFAGEYARHVAGTSSTVTVNPHNEYLNIAVQLGVLGALLLLYLFCCEWHCAALLPKHERVLARGLVITFAIGCLFNSLLMDHAEGLFFAWASGLLFGGLQAPRLGHERLNDVN